MTDVVTPTPATPDVDNLQVLTSEEFAKSVVTAGGRYNTQFALGQVTSERFVDLNGDRVPDGQYVFASGQTIFAVSLPAGVRSGSRDPRDINKNGVNEDPAFALMDLDDGQRFELVREPAPKSPARLPSFTTPAQTAATQEDPPSVLRTPNGTRRHIDQPSWFNFMSSIDLMVLKPDSEINRHFGLGRVVGIPDGKDLTGDGIIDRIYTFDSGKSVMLISNFGQEKYAVMPSQETAYAQLHQQREALKGNRAQWLANNCPYDDVIELSDGRYRPMRGGAGCAQEYDRQIQSIDDRMKALCALVPAANWEDVDADGKKERTIGFVNIEDGPHKGKQYTVVIEDNYVTNK